MTNPKDYQIPPAVTDTCKALHKIYRRCEDINLDYVLQTELGVGEYNAAPDEDTIERLSKDLLDASLLIRNLKTLTSEEERRAIEAQGLLPWVFDK